MRGVKVFLGIIIGICAAVSVSFCAYGRDGNGDIVIVVDPGHGGNDGGSESQYDKESELNWQIAQALKAELQTYEGVKVYLTRGSAEWNSNTARGRLGAQVGADLFVSVHNNSSTSGSANGVEVYGTVNASYKAEVQKICEKIAARVSALGLTNRGYRARPSTDDPSADFYTMLDEAVKCGIPGLIIEHCYLSNPSDAAFINSRENRIKCGIADATAIAEYYGLSKRGVAAGSEITLVRTYSACMTGISGGSYSSSDTSVAYVSPEGVITAVGEGTAVITCTGVDGTSGSVTVRVPAVVMTGLAAGINPTFYSDPAAAAAYDKNTVMVKAIFSDGHVEQLSGGFTLGDFPASDDGIFDVQVSYGGLSCPLRIYGVGGYLGNYNANNYKVIGTNEDILLFPPVYNGINTGIRITTGGSMQAGAPVVVPPPPVEEPDPPIYEPEPEKTEGNQPEPATTEEETTEEGPAETDKPEETEAPEETDRPEETKATEEGTEQGNTTGSDIENKKPGSDSASQGRPLWLKVCIGVLIAVIIAAVSCITFLVVKYIRGRRSARR